MRTFILLSTTMFFVALLSLAPSTDGLGVETPGPTTQLKPTIDKVVELLRSNSFKNEKRCAQCDLILAEVKERFDFHEMSKRVLGKEWRTLSAAQQNEFVDQFTRLLQYAYIGKVDDYANQEVLYKGERVKEDRAEVTTELVGDKVVLPVSYIMLLEGDKWMVYDIVVEGISLVRNYMEQFREILHREQYSGLMKQLDKKIKELEVETNNRPVS